MLNYVPSPSGVRISNINKHKEEEEEEKEEKVRKRERAMAGISTNFALMNDFETA